MPEGWLASGTSIAEQASSPPLTSSSDLLIAIAFASPEVSVRANSAEVGMRMLLVFVPHNPLDALAQGLTTNLLAERIRFLLPVPFREDLLKKFFGKAPWRLSPLMFGRCTP